MLCLGTQISEEQPPFQISEAEPLDIGSQAEPGNQLKR